MKLNEYYLKEGILLEYDKIILNLGLWVLVKLMMNSFKENLDND